MISNIFKIAWRNLLKDKKYFFISTIGLTLGISVALLIRLWILDEISFNKYYKNYHQIARIVRKEGKDYSSFISPTGLGTLLKNNYGNHFEKVVLVRGMVEERSIAFNESVFLQNGYFMQPEGAEMFSLKMIYGQAEGLHDINSIFLSESLSEKIFGEINPVGQIVKMDATWDLKVTGVFEDLPKNSDFKEASYFAPLDLYLQGWSSLNIWNNFNMYIYVQIYPNGNFESASAAIKHVMSEHSDSPVHEVFLLPWKDWKSEFKNGIKVSSQRFIFVRLFAIIGVFVLILACINYINLNTAQSENRSNEIGIKKTFGSGRGLLMSQFMIESFFTVVAAFVVSVILVYLLLPLFNRLTDKAIIIAWGNLHFWIPGFYLVTVTTILAGAYPAFYLSSVNPLKNMKKGKNLHFIVSPRKVLVIFQYTVSMVLIIGSFVIYKQIKLAKNRPVGYNREGLLTLPARSPELIKNYEVLRAELKKSGMVSEIAESNYSITSDKGWNGYFNWKGKNFDYNPSFNTMNVTPEYAKTIGLNFVKGRDFSREIASDKSGVILNNSALQFIGLRDPIGEILSWHPPFLDKPLNFTIIGIVEDFVKGSPYEPSFPSILYYSDPQLNQLFIRLNPEVNLRDALPEVEKVFRRIVPSLGFDFKFVDDEYNKKFVNEEQLGNIAFSFTIIAFFISCLGLLGVFSFLTKKRTKEIGIRKISGAKVNQVITLLSGDIIGLMIFAFIIACPIAWLLMSKWLENFAYKTEICWWIFATAGAMAMIIALLTVSFQSYKAAIRNPVESLKYE